MLPLRDSTSSPCPSIRATLAPSFSQSVSADSYSSPFKHALKHTKEDTIDIKINGKYLLDNGVSGICVFIGNTSFARGEWIGLVIENAYKGNNNGTINNKQYFVCAKNKGLFIRKEKIIQTLKPQKRSKHKEKPNKEKEDNNTKIAVSFFNHKHIESADIDDVLLYYDIIKECASDSDSELSLDFGTAFAETPSTSTTATQHSTDGDIDHDDTPDTFSKLNDYFSANTLQVNNSKGDEQRRKSMNETLNDNDTVHISALPRVQKRMKMYSNSESWSQIQYKIDHNDQNKPFLEAKVPHKQVTPCSNTKKMGPIDIGRIDYKTPFHEIEKSPFDIEQYKTWYPRKTPRSTTGADSKKQIRFNLKTRKQRSASTIDTNWRRKNSDKVWIEKKLCLVRNSRYKAKITRNSVKEKKATKLKKKKKKKAKSSRKRVKKQKQKVNGFKSIRTSSGPLIGLNNKNINVIMEDYCMDHEEQLQGNEEYPVANTLMLHRSQSHSPSNSVIQNGKTRVHKHNVRVHNCKSQAMQRRNDTKTMNVKHFFL